MPPHANRRPAHARRRRVPRPARAHQHTVIGRSSGSGLGGSRPSQPRARRASHAAAPDQWPGRSFPHGTGLSARASRHRPTPKDPRHTPVTAARPRWNLTTLPFSPAAAPRGDAGHRQQSQRSGDARGVNTGPPTPRAAPLNLVSVRTPIADRLCRAEVLTTLRTAREGPPTQPDGRSSGSGLHRPPSRAGGASDAPTDSVAGTVRTALTARPHNPVARFDTRYGGASAVESHHTSLFTEGPFRTPAPLALAE